MQEPFEGADESGREGADGDSIESLLESEDTETVVERLRESGPRYYVSESNVDDILESIAPKEDDTDADSHAFDGKPTRIVSAEGIDDVFEKLEAEAPSHDEEPTATSARTERRADDLESSPFARAAEEPDFEELKREYGSLSGRAPEKTISDESVDDILALVSDDDPDDAADRSPNATVDEAIRPDDSAAAMSSLLDDAVAPDEPEPADEFTWN